VSLEFLSNFEKQWEDSVIMLDALRETWNKKREQSILNMATLLKVKE
jgi:archaellum biogenesis ATPase FlaH